MEDYELMEENTQDDEAIIKATEEARIAELRELYGTKVPYSLQLTILQMEERFIEQAIKDEIKMVLNTPLYVQPNFTRKKNWEDELVTDKTDIILYIIKTYKPSIKWTVDSGNVLRLEIDTDKHSWGVKEWTRIDWTNTANTAKFFCAGKWYTTQSQADLQARKVKALK